MQESDKILEYIRLSMEYRLTGKHEFEKLMSEISFERSSKFDQVIELLDVFSRNLSTYQKMLSSYRKQIETTDYKRNFQMMEDYLPYEDDPYDRS